MAIDKIYTSDEALCKWLKKIGTGELKFASYAAERIETLTLHLANVQAECAKLEIKLRRETNE